MTTSVQLRLLFLLLLGACVQQLAVGQITFSKSWGPGKRSPPGSGCGTSTLPEAARTFAANELGWAELKRLLRCNRLPVIAQDFRNDFED